MQLLTKTDDLVSLFMQGRISEYILQTRLERLTQENIDTSPWSQFLIDINETRRPIQISAETKQMIIERLPETQLIDLAVKTKGNDYICALAINAMKDQESLRIVLQFYHRFSPFKTYTWDGDKLIYTDRPVGMSFERGGLAVWALLQRIDQEHFKQAWNNCGRESKWVDQLRNNKGSGRYFSGYGFPGWEGKAAMCYQDLLPEVEHRIILAEAGVEMKTPFYMRNGEEDRDGRTKIFKLRKRLSD